VKVRKEHKGKGRELMSDDADFYRVHWIKVQQEVESLREQLKEQKQEQNYTIHLLTEEVEGLEIELEQLADYMREVGVVEPHTPDLNQRPQCLECQERLLYQRGEKTIFCSTGCRKRYRGREAYKKKKILAV
jgi:hypothetical protein